MLLEAGRPVKELSDKSSLTSCVRDVIDDGMIPPTLVDLRSKVTRLERFPTKLGRNPDSLQS
ncbi:hypothetical protein HanRHA438_Chr07g0321601 [Helianthus annuus]|nr:hypothetical protein HanRHA438_Chr07g0321601 [Helianthus annuus]